VSDISPAQSELDLQEEPPQTAVGKAKGRKKAIVIKAVNDDEQGMIRRMMRPDLNLKGR
jgi:hypothetical protein